MAKMDYFSAVYFFLEKSNDISAIVLLCIYSSCFNNVLELLFDCLKAFFIMVRLKSRRHNARICQRRNTRLHAISATAMFRSLEINHHSQCGLQVCLTQKYFSVSAATGNINFMLLSQEEIYTRG